MDSIEVRQKSSPGHQTPAPSKAFRPVWRNSKDSLLFEVYQAADVVKAALARHIVTPSGCWLSGEASPSFSEWRELLRQINDGDEE